MLSVLASPIKLGPRTAKNRLFMPAHDTGMARRGLVSDEMIAYLQARAEGGLGLIVVQAAGVHPTAKSWPKLMMADTDECIGPFRRLVDALKPHGVLVLGQLFHPGRLIHGRTIEGMLPTPVGPSAMPNEAHFLNAVAMGAALVEEVIEGYGQAAGRMAAAGLDGVEITAAHGYLPWQFLNAASNCRTDQYGGDLEGRLLFLRRCLERARAAIGPDRVLGLRISADDGDLESPEVSEILQALLKIEQCGLADYFSLAFGNENSHMGGAHVIAPMDRPTGYVRERMRQLKGQLRTPILAVGRINDPAVAEQMIQEGAADMCGSARANLCDPDFARKALSGRSEEVRACIACNQACVGHLELGYSISCIQHPESGRERTHGRRGLADKRRAVMVIGGGPAGLKAAAVAAERGHRVKLFEAGAQLGGQVLLAQNLPARSEFGGAATNLTREALAAGAEVFLKTRVERMRIDAERPDVVIVATGARPRALRLNGEAADGIVDAWRVIAGQVNVGKNVVVHDWRSDWIGPGVAELLAARGCYVRLTTSGSHVGEMLQQYVRDLTAGRLHTLGVPVYPYTHLAGFEDGTVYAQHAVTGAPVLLEDAETLVICGMHEAQCDIDLEGLDCDIRWAGDCVAPRTLEEAVYEGLLAGEAV